MIQEKFHELQEDAGVIKKVTQFLDISIKKDMKKFEQGKHSKLTRELALFRKEIDEFKHLIKDERKFLQAVYDYSEDLLDDIEELGHFGDIKAYWEELVKVEEHLKTIEKKEKEFLYRFNKKIIRDDISELIRENDTVALKILAEKHKSFESEFKLWLSTFMKITEKLDERLIEISHDVEKYYYLDKELKNCQVKVAKARKLLLKEPKNINFFVDDSFMEGLKKKFDASFDVSKMLKQLIGKKLHLKLPRLKKIYTEKLAAAEEAQKEIQSLNFFTYKKGALGKNESLTFTKGMIVQFAHFAFKLDNGFHVLNGKVHHVKDKYTWKEYAFKIDKNSLKNLNEKLTYKIIKKPKNYFP